MEQTTHPTKHPVKKFTNGDIHAAVFPQVNKRGDIWYSVSVYRRYRTSDGTYCNASTYSVRDLNSLSAVASEAQNWIVEQERENSLAEQEQRGTGTA